MKKVEWILLGWLVLVMTAQAGSITIKDIRGFHEPTLCKDNEEVFFSCAAESKTISLCALTKTSKTKERLTYRFGKIGKAIEMEYPQYEIPPRQAFKFARGIGAKGGSEQLAFTVGEFTYTLYSYHWGGPTEPEQISGMLVETNNKHIANIQCTDPVSQLGMHDIGEDTFPSVSKIPQEHFLGLPSSTLRDDVP